MKNDKKAGNRKASLNHSENVGLYKMPSINVAYYSSVGYQAQKSVWNVLLEWAHKNGLLSKTSRFFGFPNPFHQTQAEISGYEAWIVIPNHVKPKPDKLIKVKSVPSMTYAYTQDSYDTSQELHNKLEEWVVLHKFEFEYAVCLEEFTFDKPQFDIACLTYFYMPVKTALEKQKGEVVDLAPMLVSRKVCVGAENDIGRAVHWYVSEWATRYWNRDFYSLCRVFVTQNNAVQEMLISYPDDCNMPYDGLEKILIPGGKYLSFTMCSLVLRRYIPQYFKILISLGYTYDNERQFLEEHYKHCGDFRKMMMGRIYFPIK